MCVWGEVMVQGGGDLMGTRVSLMASLDVSSFLTPGTVGVSME